ncbi:MAG: SIS domain-containing protein [Methanobrevibacter sp.]|nr:SIS domain-containing protein [Candidatus Methanovirga basalitermitum]
MKYQMYDDIIEQPKAIKETTKAESSHMNDISEKLANLDRIYLVGSGSSLSTLYSVKDALEMVSNLNIDVCTGFEFYYNKRIDNKNMGGIFTSQSGETGDTLTGLRKANELEMYTVSITNEDNSHIYNEAKDSILTRATHEESILGTKTYISQLYSLYNILFKASDYEKSENLLKEMKTIPDLMEKIIKTSEQENKELAEKMKDEEIFYCMGSGPNFGLAYKTSMTMFMEGALKHSCPLYSSEFRHGLIERAEENVPIVFLDADYPSDEITKKAIEFSNGLNAKTMVFNLKDYANIDNLLSPFILAIPLEWFVYYLSDFNGEDPGSTRHIGKVRY